MLALFLDESGDHNLVKIDPQSPLFLLGGIIVDRRYALKPPRNPLAAGVEV